MKFGVNKKTWGNCPRMTLVVTGQPAVKMVLLPEAHDKRFHLHENTTEKIKQNGAASSGDVDLTYATVSSFEVSDASPANKSVVERRQVQATPCDRLCQSSSVVHTSKDSRKTLIQP